MPPPIRFPSRLAEPTPQIVAAFAPDPTTYAQPAPGFSQPIPSEPLGFDVTSPLAMDIGGNAPPALDPARTPAFLRGPLSLVPRAPAAPAAAPGSYADEPMLAHGDTGGQMTRSDPFAIPEMPSNLVDPTFTPSAPQYGATLREHARVATTRPRLLGGRSLAAPTTPQAPEPDFIDQMIARPGSIWQEPRETAYDRERRAIGEAVGLEVQGQEMLARQAMERADAEEAYRAQQAAHENERRQVEGEARASIVRAADRLAQMRVDPGRYYRNAGVVGMLGNAIAVGLGAMGEALGGGPNVALQQINAAIDRDIASQEQDIATASEDVSNRRGILGDVQREMTTRQGAIEATRAIMFRELAAQAEAQSAGQGSAEAQAAGRRLRDALLTQQEQAQAAAERAEIEGMLELRQTVARIRRDEARAAQEEIRAGRMAAAGMGGGAARQETATSAQWAAFRDGMANGLPRDLAAQSAGIPEHLWPSLTGSPVTTEQRSALDAMDAGLRIIEQGIEESRVSGDIEGVGLLDSNLPAFLQSDQGLRMRIAINNMIDLLGRLRSGAAISEDEERRFSRLIEGGGTERELRAGIAQIRTELAARLGLGGRRQSGAGAADEALAATGVRQVE